MSYRGSWKIDDYLTFCCNTHDPDTGVATDADSVPTYRVYEDETGTPILTGSMAFLDAANTTGFYSERIQLTTANGFEKGKCYTVYIAATVDSDPGTTHHNFQIEAEVDANTVSVTPDVNVAQISGDSGAADNAEAFFDGTGYAGTNNVIPTVSALTGHTAQTGDGFARLGAPAGASLAADLLTIDNLVDDLESRLTAARAGYLDELAAANLPADVDTLLARITAAVALASICTETRLAELDAANLPTDIADVPTVAEMTAAFTEIKGAGWSGATDTLEEIADSIAAAAPLPYHPDASSTVVTGTETNTYADAASDNAVRWLATDAGAGIEMIAEMNLGSGRVATALTVNGYFDAGASRIVEIWHYDYVSAAYVKLSDGTAAKEMRNSASDNDYTFSLPQSATDRATVPGEVKIKFLAAQTNATDELFLDLVEVAGVASGATSPEAIADAIATSDWGESVNHIPRFTGEVLYVAGSTGNDSNSGIYPDSGLATIGAAITAASAGGYLKVFADSFTEAVNLSKNGLELHGEIGAIITGASGVPLTISADYCRVDEIILTPAAGQIGLVVTGDYNKIRIIRITGGLTAVQDTGTGNEITLVAAEEYTATGFDLQGPSGYVCDCLAKSSQASTRGFYLSNTAADRTVVNRSTSVNNDTAGFEIVADVVNAVIVNCSESPTCGARVDNGTNTSWRNHSRTDHQTDISSTLTDTNELQTDDVPGLIGALNDVSTAEVNTEVDAALADIHLDHLLAADYDPAGKPGIATALLNELVESDGGVSRFTANALEEAPTGGSAPTVEEIRTEMDDNSTQLTAIAADTNELQTDDVPGLIAALNDVSTAEVNTQVDTALADIHLDHLLATDYDPASKPGTATALLNELVESDGGVSRFTENALEQAPSGTGASAATIADAVWNEAAADHVGGGSFGEEVQSHATPAEVDTECDEALTDYDGPTNAEMEARTLPSADYFDASSDAVANVTLVATTTTNTDVRGTDNAALASVCTEARLAELAAANLPTDVDAILADTNELQTDDIPGAISSLNDPTAAAVRTEIDSSSTQLAAIVADTNELQGDDVPGLISALNDPTAVAIRTEIDSNSTQLAAIVADTNELQTDDIPGAISGLNDLSAADVNAEVDTALADIHLDHLLAADYDPASKPGTATALLNELIESDGGVSRFTENSLEQAPSGTGASAATIADAVWNEAQVDHVGAGSFGEEVQAHALSSEVATAAGVWAHGTRTLTQSAVSIAAAVSGSDLSIYRGDSLSASITGLGDISGRTRLWLTVKEKASHGDAAATFQIEEGAGLLYIDGEGAGTAGNGAITVDDEDAGDITVTLDEAETAKLRPNNALVYDVQVLDGGDVTTLTAGDAEVTADVTRIVA